MLSDRPYPTEDHVSRAAYDAVCRRILDGAHREAARYRRELARVERVVARLRAGETVAGYTGESAHLARINLATELRTVEDLIRLGVPTFDDIKAPHGACVARSA